MDPLEDNVRDMTIISSKPKQKNHINKVKGRRESIHPDQIRRLGRQVLIAEKKRTALAIESHVDSKKSRGTKSNVTKNSEKAESNASRYKYEATEETDIEFQVKCDIPPCSYLATGRRGLIQHYKTEHKTSEDCQFDGCKFTHDTYSQARHHYLTEHNKFKCKECTFITSFFHFFKNHIWRHKDPISCLKCGKAILSCDDDIFHRSHCYNQVRNNQILKCKLCEYENSNKHNVIYHYFSTHGWTFESMIYTCGYCLSEFSEQTCLGEHFAKVHSGVSELYRCGFCNSNFNNSVDFKLHSLSLHMDDKSKEDQNTKKKTQKSGITRKQAKECKTPVKNPAKSTQVNKKVAVGREPADVLQTDHINVQPVTPASVTIDRSYVTDSRSPFQENNELIDNSVVFNIEDDIKPEEIKLEDIYVSNENDHSNFDNVKHITPVKNQAESTQMNKKVAVRQKLTKTYNVNMQSVTSASVNNNMNYVIDFSTPLQGNNDFIDNSVVIKIEDDIKPEEIKLEDIYVLNKTTHRKFDTHNICNQYETKELYRCSFCNSNFYTSADFKRHFLSLHLEDRSEEEKNQNTKKKTVKSATTRKKTKRPKILVKNQAKSTQINKKVAESTDILHTDYINLQSVTPANVNINMKYVTDKNEFINAVQDNSVIIKIEDDITLEEIKLEDMYILNENDYSDFDTYNIRNQYGIICNPIKLSENSSNNTKIDTEKVDAVRNSNASAGVFTVPVSTTTSQIQSCHNNSATGEVDEETSIEIIKKAVSMYEQTKDSRHFPGCNICNAIIFDPQGLIEHYSKHHSDVYNSLEYKCIYCNHIFNRIGDIREHCKSMHPNETLIYSCSTCSFVTKNAAHLEFHNLKQHKLLHTS